MKKSSNAVEIADIVENYDGNTPFPSDLSDLTQFIDPDYQDVFSRLSDRLNSGAMLKDIARWLRENTFLNQKPWSFKDHEFQIAIANEQAQVADIQKCSQVGLSELSVRWSLSLLVVSNNKNLIYVLPSSKFASKFAKTRIDPVIEQSSKIKEALITAADSSEMKRFGNSILYISGAATVTQAISMPADILVIDEYDFCNAAVLTSFMSRLRHAENGGMRRNFSTPTVTEYGISARVDKSTQNHYLVKCRHCGEEGVCDFATQVRIPGFDAEFSKFSKEDLLDVRIDVNRAYLECPSCKDELDSSLMRPELRRWVAKFPEREVAGYVVAPQDLIKYNATARVVKQLGEYAREQDFHNFVLGRPFSSKENQIQEAIVRQNMVLDFVEKGESGFYMGIDVGKVCHVIVGRMEGLRYKVHYAAKVRAIDGPLEEQLAEIYVRFNCFRAVIDAGPDFTLGQALILRFGEFFGQCVYVRGNPRNPTYWSRDEKTGMLTAARTKGLDSLVQTVNAGMMQFPRHDIMNEVVHHFTQVKRVEEMNDEGEKVAKWVKVTEMDHFFHTLFYFKLACDIDYEPSFLLTEVVGSSPVVTGATVSKASVPAPEHSVREVLSLFGVR